MSSKAMKKVRVSIMAGLMTAIVAVSAFAVNVTAKTNTTMYSKAKQTSAKVAAVKEGTSRKVLKTTKYYYKIKLNGKTGYIKRSAVLVEDADVQNALAETAKAQIGKKYKWGGKGPDEFDCSGLTAYVYAQNKKTIPGTTKSQYASAVKIRKSGLKNGDLVFFSNDDSKKVGVVGIYVGDNQVVMSANSRKGVTQVSLTTNYYNKHFISGGRY